MKQSAIILIGVLVIAVASVGVCGYFDATSTDDNSNNEEIEAADNNSTDENSTEDNTTSENSTNNTNSSSNNSTSSSSSNSSSSSSSSSSKSSSSSSSDDDYYYSGQYGGYIREWTDSNGIQHTESKDGKMYSSYDERTGVETGVIDGEPFTRS